MHARCTQSSVARASGVSLSAEVTLSSQVAWRPITARSHRQWVYTLFRHQRAERPEDEAAKTRRQTRHDHRTQPADDPEPGTPGERRRWAYRKVKRTRLETKTAYHRVWRRIGHVFDGAAGRPGAASSGLARAATPGPPSRIEGPLVKSLSHLAYPGSGSAAGRRAGLSP